MQAGRRQFLCGLLAASIMPQATWADAGSPAYLSAAANADGSYILCGINSDLTLQFQIPLPDRGHAAAAHPVRPEAVAFARRPGTFALVIDCVLGTRTATLASPAGRHFYGHGAFSADGKWLFTTENDYEAGQGRVGVWDVDAGYIRQAEFSSGGVGPHDIKRLPGSDILVVANGGIDTHPDSGRTKLNIPTMHPNLTYIKDGSILEIASLDDDLHKNSIRHIAIGPSGQVAFGMQWQGEAQINSLVGFHTQGGPITLMKAAQDKIDAMQNYVGSVAFSHDGQLIAATSPRGGVIQIYDTATSALRETLSLDDASGVAPNGTGFAVTAGSGEMRKTTVWNDIQGRPGNLMWDNHLVPINLESKGAD